MPDTIRRNYQEETRIECGIIDERKAGIRCRGKEERKSRMPSGGMDTERKLGGIAPRVKPNINN